MTEQLFIAPNDLVFIQSRVMTNYHLADEYAEMMQAGVQFDAAQGIRDDSGQIYIYDGLHRGEAARKTGTHLLVCIKPGTKQDAEWQALTANQKHGLRRSWPDIQRIVRTALRHPYGVNLSDREIARHCGVDHKTVGKIRQDLELSGEIPQIERRMVTRNGQTYEQDTHAIGGQPPDYVSGWALEQLVRRWLSDLSDHRGDQIRVLEEIKRKTPAGRERLAQLLEGDLLPLRQAQEASQGTASPRRKADILQACNNVLAQMWQAEKKVFEDCPCPDCGGRVFYAAVLAGLICEQCWRQWDNTSDFRREAQLETPRSLRAESMETSGDFPQMEPEREFK